MKHYFLWEIKKKICSVTYNNLLSTLGLKPIGHWIVKRYVSRLSMLWPGFDSLRWHVSDLWSPILGRWFSPCTPVCFTMYDREIPTPAPISTQSFLCYRSKKKKKKKKKKKTTKNQERVCQGLEFAIFVLAKPRKLENSLKSIYLSYNILAQYELIRTFHFAYLLCLV